MSFFPGIHFVSIVEFSLQDSYQRICGALQKHEEKFGAVAAHPENETPQEMGIAAEGATDNTENNEADADEDWDCKLHLLTLY